MTKRELTEWEKIPPPKEYSKDPIRQAKRRRQRRANPTKNQIKYRARKLREARQREGIVNQLDEHHVPKASKLKLAVVCHANLRFRDTFHIREAFVKVEGETKTELNPTKILACGLQHLKDSDVPLIRAIQSEDWCPDCKRLAQVYRLRKEWDAHNEPTLPAE